MRNARAVASGIALLLLSSVAVCTTMYGDDGLNCAAFDPASIYERGNLRAVEYDPTNETTSSGDIMEMQAWTICGSDVWRVKE